MSGKPWLNAMKALVIRDPLGRLLFCGKAHPGSMHDITQARTAGPVGLLLQAPLGVRSLADAGYQGLSTDRRGHYPETQAASTPDLTCHRASSPHARRTANGTPPDASVEPATGHRKDW